ncbi:hypothetical protein IW140_003780 [Coemansia sp. RSA 1813]|nr:hypothetical protein EV178_003506 [Coemansia sp. RSA 1646]KAJ1772809.1 hypothetical protein LPJ74_001148 [Coemansia sp. RSA 1843]KAJ2088674.1 hypothetical protein IW138_004056 [Coemansia sp. RSA 986]KAJ2213122.1 hypothetical protein EV179_004092 [Coemansia sp. RSA 487]KAJ2568574.1 hypothetical protein IW140_003780 [Coemansia sp. RSA 1813]
MRFKRNVLAAFATAFASTATSVYGYQATQDVTVAGTRLQQNGCTHPIYCDGPILKAVQLGGVFDDDKTFVDMPTRKPVDEIVAEFSQLPANATKKELTQFVNDNFYPAGCDIVVAELEDWTDNPPFLDGVTDPVLRGYGMSIHNQWKTMARKRNTSFLCDGCETSLLQANNVFFTTGDESSREYHYWNTYYIEIGLLKSGLYTTAKGVLQNLLDMVKAYDFVPTGGRIYYTDRSEPPLLALMVKTYYEATQDLDFVKEALPLLKIEHGFWEMYRSVNITYTTGGSSSDGGLRKRQSGSGNPASAKVATYGPDLFSTASNDDTQLRPESYSSDYDASKTQTSAPNLFSSLSGSDLYAASEAGTSPGVQYADAKTATQGPDLFGRRSLSRRDIEIPTTNPFASFTETELIVLGSTQINSTIAVNLNSIIYQAELIIADFIELVENNTSPECVSYRARAAERRQTLLDLTYDAETGLFSDYHLESGSNTEIWSMSSLWPYWAFGDSLPSDGVQKALENIDFLHSKFPGGLPNTLYNSSLPWDYPYIQPPMQHMAVRSAQNAENHACKNSNSTYSAPCGGTAAKIAQSTVNSAFCNWYTTGGSINNVLNSYEHAASNSSGVSFGSFTIGPDGNIVTTTSRSSQGNYAWTNGINIWILDSYKAQLQMPSCPNIKLNLVEHTPPPPPPPPHPTPTPTPTPTPPSPPPPQTYTTVAPPPPTSYYTTSPLPPLTSYYSSRRSCVRKRVCRRCHRVVKRKWVSRDNGANCVNPNKKRAII